MKIKVRELSLRYFGRFLDIPVVVNGRLKRSLGRLVYRKCEDRFEPLRIELSPAVLKSDELFNKTVLHELSHWFLMIGGKNFRHNSSDFKRLSEELDFPVK